MEQEGIAPLQHDQEPCNHGESNASSVTRFWSEDAEQQQKNLGRLVKQEVGTRYLGRQFGLQLLDSNIILSRVTRTASSSYSKASLCSFKTTKKKPNNVLRFALCCSTSSSRNSQVTCDTGSDRTEYGHTGIPVEHTSVCVLCTYHMIPGTTNSDSHHYVQRSSINHEFGGQISWC